MTYQAVAGLLDAHPQLDALYNVAGGNAGLARAVREAGRSGAIFVVSHEANGVTVPLLRDGLIHYVIAQNPSELLSLSIRAASQAEGRMAKEVNLIDFAVYTKFNIPFLNLFRRGSLTG